MLKKFTLLGPFVGFVIYLGFLFYLRQTLPHPQVILDSLSNLYKSYGYGLLFASGLVESLFLVGFLIPGSTVILIGASLSKTGVLQFPYAYFSGLLGLMIGFSINYVLGRYGWYHLLAYFGLEKGITEAKKKLEKHGAKAILLGYIHPGSASLLSTAAGVLKMSFLKFLALSIIAQGVWGLMWGGIAYIFGLSLIDFIIRYFGFVVLAIVVIWYMRHLFSKRRSSLES